MSVLKIVIAGVVFAILIVVVRENRSEIAIVLSCAAGIVLFFFAADYLQEILFVLTGIVERAGIESSILSALFKIVGTGYICEFAANLCEDYGCKSVGDKISLAGKIVILFLTLPVLSKIVDLIMSMI